MIDERIFLIIVPAIFLWCIMIPSHRKNFVKSDKVDVGRVIALLAGSKTNYVARYAFGLQLGNLSMILWYIVFSLSTLNYLVTNAYVLCVLTGTITGLLLQRVLKFYSH